ncbi:hypothetical protein BD779DRAFT_1678481 [Infundibulicybe gibba]|nr:hypothetical protein BD779DRAFT_1678481 [Infundibulicybe gibba]
MIRSHGTADGFNTEGSERLHIDYAKLGYAATNKKDYIKQMTVWLMRQEAVDTFAAYLQWAVPGYVVESDIQCNTDEREKSDEPGDSDELEHTVENISTDLQDPSLKYVTAKHAPHPAVPLSIIEREYGAVSFIPCLEQFLRTEGILAANFYQIDTTFPVFKRVTVQIPPVRQVSREFTKDIIRATPSYPATNHKKAIPSRFDTVLARKHKPASIPKPLSLKGLCVAQVRVIFHLPKEYGEYSHPLAYVEWFKELRPEPEVNTVFPDAGLVKQRDTEEFLGTWMQAPKVRNPHRVTGAVERGEEYRAK